MDAVSWTLTGRSDELHRVLDLLTNGSTDGVVLVGPAGVGKSRLTTEVLDLLGDDIDHRLVVATPGAATIPFGCLAHLLGDPPLRRLDAPALLDTFRAVRQQLLAGASGELVVAVDDAHLLDEASAALFGQLATVGDARLLVNVRAGAACPDAITALWKNERCTRIELGPLDADEVGRLAATALGGPLARGSIERLHEVSGGNPLFVRELLLDATAAGTLRMERNLWHWRGVAGGLRLTEVVESHLGRLGESTADLVDLVAMGEPLPLEALAHHAGVDLVDTLEADGIFTISSDDRPTMPPGARSRGTAGRQLVRLAHPLFGEVRRASIGEGRRRVLQRRLLTLFSSATDLDRTDLLRVASWSLDAGQPLDPVQLLDAARAARDLSDLHRCADLARAALERGGGPDAAVELAEALEWLGATDAAIVALDQALDAMSDEGIRARALACGIRLQAMGRLDEARALASRAGDIGDATWRGFVEAQWATSLVLEGHMDEARPLIDTLADHPDPRVRLRVLSATNLVLLADGRILDARATAEAAIRDAFARRNEIPRGVIWAFSAMVLDLLAAGDLDALDRVLEVAAADVTATNDGSLGFQLLLQAKIALHRGQAGLARRAASESATLLGGIDELGLGPLVLGTVAEASAILGDTTAATAAAAEAGALLDDQPSRPFAAEVARAIAWAPVADGDVISAEAALCCAADVAQAAGHRTIEAGALFDAVRVGASQTTQRRLIELAGTIQGPLAEGWVRYTTGVLDDDPSELEHAGEHFAALGFLMVAAEAFTLASRSHHRGGVAAGARRAGTRATALRDAIDALGAHQLDLPPDLPTLSRREQQIAVLAADGRSSRQIAEQLAVSTRTVDNQLSRVYQKLGISGRRELPEALGR
ncbi:MAG: AAA family ATPase [Acidimicrobiia bacterium]|nr:AAA family ATPase [Acidimicrobiia bacterium]